MTIKSLTKLCVMMLCTYLFFLFIIKDMITDRQNHKKAFVDTNFHHMTVDARDSVDCLAQNMYFEARSEPTLGQIAVAMVTINRVKSEDFPDNICDVVEQRVKRVCQFSWYCQKKPKYIYTKKLLTTDNNSLYNDIHRLALLVYANYDRLKDPTHGSTFYHADYVSPNWPNVKKVATIGRHIFYIQI